MAVELTSLVGTSSPFLLAYSLPLLLLSVVITFAGTFLTLDRTRTFAPRSDADPTPPIPGSLGVEKPTASLLRKFRLDGGLGGLAMGYVFGLHVATFLSLLIMNESSASPLTSTAFLVVWVFSIIPLTILGGRWRIAALTFIGITGGITMSLALCIITHPTLISRVVVTSIFTPLVTLAVIVPSILPSPSLSNLIHSTSRMATSCAGAFSVTMAIALLTRSQESLSWANAWERLWVADGDSWGTSREKGFDALFCALWICGALADLGLKRWIGEDPDEKWDTYLANYVTSLPNANDRAGKFIPLPSWWDRLLKALHLSTPDLTNPHEILFPSDAELALKPQYISVPDVGDDEKPAIYLSKEDLQRAVSPAAYNWEPPSPIKGARFLRKERTRLGKGFILKDDLVSQGATQDMLNLARLPTCLKKAKSARVEQRRQRLAEKCGRRRLEFQPADGFSSDSDEVSSDMDVDELKTPVGTPARERDVYVRSPGFGSAVVRMHSSATSLSGTTVHPSGGATLCSDDAPDALDVRREKARLADIKQSFGVATARTLSAPDYSDVEEDVTTAYARTPSPGPDMSGWQPAFIKRANSSSSSSSIHQARKTTTETIPPPGAVSMTPSLIRAVERIDRAQAQVYGQLPNLFPKADEATRHNYPPAPRREHVALDIDVVRSIPGLPVISEERKQRQSEDWDEFWKDIRAKAAEVDLQH